MHKDNKKQDRPSRLSSLLADEQLRAALWFGAAAFLVFYLGAMLILRVVLVSGTGSGYDSIIVAVVAVIAGIIAGRKKYRDEI
nr:hypothetical protein [Corynebacterium lactis]